MAIFYQPPPPFVGGSGPLLPRELPPVVTAVQVDNPPFAIALRDPVFLLIARLWDALPEVARQAPRRMPQGAAAAAATPYTRSRVIGAFLAAGGTGYSRGMIVNAVG